MVSDVVRDVSAGEEGGLGDIDDIVQGAVEAIGDDVHDQLGVAIQEGDGAVAAEFVGWLPRLEEKANDSHQEVTKGARGGGVLEGRVEDEDKRGGKDGLEVTVELVWEAIYSRG